MGAKRITYRIVWSLKKPENDIVEVKFPLRKNEFKVSHVKCFQPYRIVVTNSGRPESQHTPKRNEDAEEIGEQEHGLGLELEVSLDVPKAEGRRNGACRLRDTKIGNL